MDSPLLETVLLTLILITLQVYNFLKDCLCNSPMEQVERNGVIVITTKTGSGRAKSTGFEVEVSNYQGSR